jgi:hypothetical protein
LANGLSSAQWLGWKPTEIGLAADITRPNYFAA